MKANILKWCFSVVFVLSGLVMFAQSPGGTAQDEATDPLENPDTPINGRILYLAIAAIAFSVFYFRKVKTVKS